MVLGSCNWSRYSSTWETLSLPSTVHAKVGDRDPPSTGCQVPTEQLSWLKRLLMTTREGLIKSEVETRRLSLSEKILVPRPSLQVKPFEHAQCLSNATLSIVLQRIGDPNVLPFVHVTLVLIFHIACNPCAMRLLEASFLEKL
jgi:hypothetical protein